MRLLDITAVSAPGGNQIDLAWSYPPPPPPPAPAPPPAGVRVVRRVGSHPTRPDDGVVVKSGIGLTTASDSGLKGETVYYYTLFPFTGDPPQFDPDPHNQASAMATSRYDFAGQLYTMLPAIYRRYDVHTPAEGSGAPGDLDKGELRRFLDLPGGELDRLYSLTRAMLAFADPGRVDGRLLPLLAQWIGWRTNYGLPVDAQRNEIRFAPEVYQTIGGIPTVDSTVARVTGWTNRTKEFVHNVARTNQPERLNLWSALRDGAGTWAAPSLASVNFAHDGRPAVVREADGSLLFFYHTFRQHGWDIWAKRFNAGAWEASEPVVDQPGIDKHPTAALVGSTLWLFWQSYDPAQPAADRRWRISFAGRTPSATSATGTTWSVPAVFGDDAVERRMPTAVADNTGGLWLFWLERVAGVWQLRYQRYVGANPQPTSPRTLPLDGTAAPRVEDDLFVLFHPGSANQRLWLFWARQEPGGPAGQTRWSVVYRIKQGLDPAASDWSPIRALPKTGGGDYHDRQPAAIVTAGGDLELFWSSTIDGGWHIKRNTLAVGPLTWGSTQPVISGPYSRRAPLAVDTGSGTLLAYRSNESLAYASTAFGATHTLDNRYAGTTTVDTRGKAKLDLRGTFEDFQTYIHDAGPGRVRNNDNRVARDTIGLFLTPDIADPDEIKAVISRLASVLADFMPVTARAVFITPRGEHDG